jgi:metal-responsive CopG/Arc/MetJ family transcriptional regulator
MTSRSAVTVTLSRPLLKRLDILGQRRGMSRSRLFEALLLAGERTAETLSLQEELAAYYAVPQREADSAAALSLARAARIAPKDEHVARKRKVAARRGA